MTATQIVDYVEVHITIPSESASSQLSMGLGVVWNAHHVNAAKTPVSVGEDKEHENETCRARIVISRFLANQMLGCTTYSEETIQQRPRSLQIQAAAYQLHKSGWCAGNWW